MRTLYTLDVLMLPETQAPYNSSTKNQNSEESYFVIVHASVDDFRYRPYLFPEIRLQHVNALW